MSLPSAKSCFRWAFFLGLLTALGVGVYVVQPHEARWSVVWDGQAILPDFFSPDGSQICFTPAPAFARDRKSRRRELAAAALDERTVPNAGRIVLVSNQFQDVQGGVVPLVLERKLHAWDAATGVELARYPNEGNLERNDVVSHDRRFFASECAEGKEIYVCLVDVDAKQELMIPRPADMWPDFIGFTRSGRFLVLRFSSDNGKKSTVRVYDTTTGKLTFTPTITGIVQDQWTVGDQLLLDVRQDEKKRQVEIWNLAERKLHNVLNDICGSVEVFETAEILLVNEHDDDDQRTGKWLVWNLKTGKLQARFITKFDDARFQRVVASSQGEWLAIQGENWIECWERTTGKKISESPTQRDRSWLTQSPNSRYLAGWRLIDGSMRLRVVAMPTLTEIWRAYGRGGPFDFTRDSERIVVAPWEQDSIHIHELSTGKMQATIRILNTNIRTRLDLPRDGRNLLVVQPNLGFRLRDAPTWQKMLAWVGVNPERFAPKYSDCTVVFDLESNRERFRLQGWNTDDAMLSDDGSTLVTTHSDDDDDEIQTIRCWDVTPLKPLRWALGVPAVLGLLLFGLARGYTRWRKPPSPAPVPPPAPTN